MHPAAHAGLHTTRDTLLAVPELRASLDIPEGAAAASLECGHVWTTATLFLDLNSELLWGPPLTAGTKLELLIVSYDFKRAIYMITTSNVCCGIEQISKHFTKEIKITTSGLEARKWSHKIMKLLSRASKQASDSSSTKRQLSCKSTGQCPPMRLGQSTSPGNTPIVFLERVFKYPQKQVPSWKQAKFNINI